MVVLEPVLAVEDAAGVAELVELTKERRRNIETGSTSSHQKSYLRIDVVSEGIVAV